ncbi:MAG TPA: CARDB domain-containing protein, partial [Candidatus Thermoplasmatota archaeon]|nr:CARDB domain-containing protein [Candidatus Thermoplasmatota archaeon]
MKIIKHPTIFLKLKAAVLIFLMILVSLTTLSVQSEDIEPVQTPSSDANHLIFRIPFAEPNLIDYSNSYGTFTKISMPNTYNIGSKSGNPTYPVYPMKILLPYQKEILDIDITTSQLSTLENQRANLQDKPIVPYQKSVPIGQDAPEFVFNEDVYQSSERFPEITYTDARMDEAKGYSILTLNVFPTKYEPGNNELSYFKDIIIDIELEESTEVNSLFRNNPIDEAWVKNIVTNPEISSTYTFDDVSRDTTRDYPGGLCSSTESFDYVIITREFLSDYSGQTYTWDDFINRKQSEGLDTTIVTVEDIESCADYWNDTSLFNDTAALIREFLRDAYQDWGISYVLIAGDHEGDAAIPRRLMSSGAEYNVEADLYWSNLDNTFNEDGDNSWGEEGDDGFDLYSELFIGSLTCDEALDLSNWMTKSFYYADSSEKDYLENCGFYGGDTGWSCQGDDFMDFTIYGTDHYYGPYQNSEYPPWGFMQGFDTWNVSNPGYEYNWSSVMWTADSPNEGWQGGTESEAIDGLRNAINNDHVTILNGIAHADSTMSLDVYASSWEADYHNTKPFFIHDYGCHCGDMDASDDGILHSMLFHSDTELAFAAVYNTGYGWGNFDESNSSSAWQQKLFWEYCFNLSISGSPDNWQMAKAHAYGKDALAVTIDWEDTFRENIQCSTLFGDPAQPIKIPYVPDHDIMVMDIQIPSVIAHSDPQTVSATVRNIGNNTETNIIVDFSVNGSIIDSTTIPSLDRMESTVVEFPWSPDIGTYLVSIASQPIPDEYDETNNEVNKTVSCVASPIIDVDPLSLSLMLPTEATDTDSFIISNLPNAEGVLDYEISYAGDLGGSWLSATPETGTVAIDSSDTITIIVNSTGLNEGNYEGYVIIDSNDVDDPEVIVSVQITVVYGNDMDAVSINSPTGVISAGSYTVNATVQNLGFYPQTDVTVNCDIYEGGLGGTVLDEDFSSEPVDWTITDVGGTAWTWDSSDERMENTYGYSTPNEGYLDSPVLDCSGKSGMSLSFWHYWKADYSSGSQDGYVRGSVDGGDTFPFLIDEFHHNDPAEETAVKEYDISSWADGQANVMIRFDITNDNDWYWYVDDFNVTAELAGDLVYSSEMLVGLDAYESMFVEFSPGWNPGMGLYGVQVSTLLAGDENSGNDVVAETVSVEGPGL